jgi:hypothetical protein
MTAAPAVQFRAAKIQVADWIRTLPVDEFRAIVAQDVRGEADAEAAEALRHPSVLYQWLAALKWLLMDLNTLHAARRGFPEYDEWRRSAAGFQSKVIARRAEGRRLVQQAASEGAKEASRLERQRRGEIGELAIQRLIDAHQDEFTGYLLDEYTRAGLEPPDRVLRYARPDQLDAP